MNTSTLKSLMRLFGIIANISKQVELEAAERKVNAYLEQITNPQEALQYLQMFEFHAKQYKKEVINYQKRQSALGVKATIIGEEIKQGLNQQEKTLVITNLLEILSYASEYRNTGLDFIDTIAYIFSLNHEDLENCKALVYWDQLMSPDREKFLLINASRKSGRSGVKHVFHQGLVGELIFMNTTTGAILFKYHHGDDKLYLNGRKIQENQTYLLPKGASIQSYKIAPIYFTDIARELLIPDQNISIQFQVFNASYRFPDGETGIQPFNLDEPGGQLIGIMGSSGSGKTTLLNLLNGTLRPATGKIMINGHSVHIVNENLKSLIGYVPQDDLLMEELTVYQNLYFNAQFCFKDLNKQEIDNKIIRLLKDLELFEIRNMVVGNPLQKIISGGQRKRLNLALEFIREPSVFFIDEPTSGLSSNDADKLMDLLKKQTINGALIFVNIHQPSSDIYKQLDKVMIMDQGGHMVFVGNPLDATVYFKETTDQINARESECLSCGNVNPENILSIIEQKKSSETGEPVPQRKYAPKDWYHKFKPLHKIPGLDEKKDIPQKSFSPPNRWKQLGVYFHRNLKAKLQDRQYLLVGLLEAPLLALILSYFSRYTKKLEYTSEYIFFENDNLPVFIFMSVVVAMFLGLMVSAEQIIQDKKMLKREQFLNLSRSSYLHSKIIFLFLLSAVQTFAFVLIGTQMLSMKGMTLPFALMLFSVACNANLLGLNISSGFQSLVTIYIFIPILLVPQLLLGGATLDFKNLPASMRHPKYVPLIGDLMISRWAYEGMMVYQFKNNSYQKQFMEIDQKISRTSYMANYHLPELESIVTNLSFNLRNDLSLNDEKWTLLLNELKKLEQYKKNPITNLPLRSQNLTVSHLDVLSSFLKEIRLLYSQLLNYYISEKDELINNLREQGIDLPVIREKNVNRQVSDILTAKGHSQKMISLNNEIIRKMEPVFYLSESSMGRAHFFAPGKKVLAFVMETYWFNLIFVWIISIFLYIFLQIDGLKKVISFFETSKTIFHLRIK